MTLPRLLALCCLTSSVACAETPFDPVDDAATVEYETYSQVHARGPDSSSDPRYQRFMAQLYFPAGTILEREVFGGVRAEFLDRTYRQGPQTLNDGLVHRHSVSFGSGIVKRPGQVSFLLATAGYYGADAGFEGLRNGLGFEWTYAHYFTGYERCKWGLGFDLIWFSGEWIPYPLVFLEWWALDRTKIRINADIAEARQFIGARLCLTLGARYSQSYGELGKSFAFTSESLAWEGGVEYSFHRNYLLRVKLKKLFWGEDNLAFKAGPKIRSESTDGNSLKFSLAYAL